jgi:hypothetical protein
MGVSEFSQNRYMEGPTCLTGVNNYIYACTVKRYQILTEKKVFVKSVYHIMEYTISNLVSVPPLLSYFLYYPVGVMISGEVV